MPHGSDPRRLKVINSEMYGGRERTARLVLILVAVMLAVAILGRLIKMDYVVMSPGPAIDALGELENGTRVVQVDGTITYPTDGGLYVTTVRILGGPDRPISVWELGAGIVDPDAQVVPTDQVFDGYDRVGGLNDLNAHLMAASEETSVAVALRSLGKKVPKEILVTRVTKGMPAYGALEAQDAILSVGGKRPRDVEELVTTMGGLKVGDAVVIVVRRDGREKKLTLKAEEIEHGRVGIGADVELKYSFPFEVSVDAGQVGGPSAGLMMALAVRDRLTPGAMTNGKLIAGTGTISDDGEVGSIGGIQKKVIGADKAGADWFLAPESNCPDLVGNVPDGLAVVPVTDFDDAVSAVESIARGDTATLPTCGGPD